jgi:hypothetical protein
LLPSSVAAPAIKKNSAQQKEFGLLILSLLIILARRAPSWMTDHNSRNDEDKDFSKGPTDIMNSKEQIIKLSRSYDKYLEDIWNQDDVPVWEPFHKDGNKN